MAPGALLASRASSGARSLAFDLHHQPPAHRASGRRKVLSHFVAACVQSSGTGPMTNYLRLDELEISLDRKSRSGTISCKGSIEGPDDLMQVGQSTIPDTVGHLSLLVRGRNIGAVRTPFYGKRVQIEASEGVAVVIQLDRHASVAAHLAPLGAMALAAKLLELAAGRYSWGTDAGNCPPRLEAAIFAAHDAIWEAKTTPRLPV